MFPIYVRCLQVWNVSENVTAVILFLHNCDDLWVKTWLLKMNDLMNSHSFITIAVKVAKKYQPSKNDIDSTSLYWASLTRVAWFYVFVSSPAPTPSQFLWHRERAGGEGEYECVASGSQICLFAINSLAIVISHPARRFHTPPLSVCIIFLDSWFHLHARSQISIATPKYAWEVCFFRQANMTLWMCSFLSLQSFKQNALNTNYNCTCLVGKIVRLEDDDLYTIPVTVPGTHQWSAC